MAKKPPFLLYTTCATALLVAGVFVAAEARGGECCQDQGLFEVPKLELTKPKPPEGCTKATERALVLLQEVEKEIEEPLKAAMRQAVAEKEKDETVAEAWDSAASLSLLNLHVPAALWAELTAIKTEWRSDFLVQAGVYLAMMNHDDDAKLLLHCAYDADNRSPYLLEALANIYHKAGDKSKAVDFINQAQQAAPDDELIRLQKQSFNSGQPPRRQALPADPVDAAIVELKDQINRALMEHKRTEDLLAKVRLAYHGDAFDDPDEVVAQYREAYGLLVPSLDEPRRLAKLSPEEVQRQFPGASRSMFRNMFFQQVISLYLYIADQRLLVSRNAEISERYDVGFWAPVAGYDEVQYARILRSLHDFEYEGIKRQFPGYYLEDWGGVEFYAFYEHAGRKRREGHTKCTRDNRGNPAGEDACKLEVDKLYCATVRQLHKKWMDETERHAEKFGRRFDREASCVLVQAGEVVADAYRYAAKYAKQMNVGPNDAHGQGLLAEINRKYRDLVAKGVGEGDGGPGQHMKFLEAQYLSMRSGAEATIASYKQTIEEVCQPVDQRALEQLIEEHRDAVRSMLWDRLLRDLNVSWDPNADCTFSMGKWISINVDIDGNVDVKGKWSPYKKAFEGSPTFEVGDNFQFDLEDARYATATVSVDQSKNYGPFTGKAGINVGVTYDRQTGDLTFPVNIESKLGVGYKAKYKGQDFGITCYPGSLKAKFDARVVAKDVLDLYHAL